MRIKRKKKNKKRFRKTPPKTELGVPKTESRFSGLGPYPKTKWGIPRSKTGSGTPGTKIESKTPGPKTEPGIPGPKTESGTPGPKSEPGTTHQKNKELLVIKREIHKPTSQLTQNSKLELKLK